MPAESISHHFYHCLWERRSEGWSGPCLPPAGTARGQRRWCQPRAGLPRSRRVAEPGKGASRIPCGSRFAAGEMEFGTDRGFPRPSPDEPHGGPAPRDCLRHPERHGGLVHIIPEPRCAGRREPLFQVILLQRERLEGLNICGSAQPLIFKASCAMFILPRNTAKGVHEEKQVRGGPRQRGPPRV